MRILAIIYSLFLVLLTQTLYAQEIELFTVDLIESKSGKKIGFSSLSEKLYELEETQNAMLPDSVTIDNNDFRYHILKNKYRSVSLESLGFSELDSVFVYNYIESKVFSWQVKELKIVAFENESDFDPYVGHDGTSYYIGFLMDTICVWQAHYQYSNPFVYVGETNPFIEGEIIPIIWEQETSGSDLYQYFHKVLDTHFVKLGLNSKNFGQFYSSSRHQYTFVVQEILDNKLKWSGYSYLVINNAIGTIVYSRSYFTGEGGSASSLTFQNLPKNTFSFQYTGKLFKDKPEVIIGLKNVSYGCQQIEFLSLKEKPIILKCDNRY